METADVVIVGGGVHGCSLAYALAARGVKRVILLENDFTIESGELTPTLKVKRRVVEKRYKDLVDRAYAADDARSAALEG